MRSALRTILLLVGVVALLPADVLYDVAVDTTSLLKANGYVDFQLGPSGNSQPVTASILNFSTDGLLNGASVLSAGDVSGALPGPLSIGNSTQFNDYFAAMQFGANISYRLNFSGDAVNAPNGSQQAGSRFAFSLFAADGSTPLGTRDPFGSLFIIDLNSDGIAVADTSNALIPTAVIPQSASEVPEPCTIGLLGAALLGGFGLRRFVNQASSSRA